MLKYTAKLLLQLPHISFVVVPLVPPILAVWDSGGHDEVPMVYHQLVHEGNFVVQLKGSTLVAHFSEFSYAVGMLRVPCYAGAVQ